jgi:hypothetical protein
MGAFDGDPGVKPGYTRHRRGGRFALPAKPAVSSLGWAYGSRCSGALRNPVADGLGRCDVAGKSWIGHGNAGNRA